MVWNDTRASNQVSMSELTYTYSTNGGETWAENVPVSPPFDSLLGWPRQDNGEQDVYYLRIGERVDDSSADHSRALEPTRALSPKCNLSPGRVSRTSRARCSF